MATKDGMKLWAAIAFLIIAVIAAVWGWLRPLPQVSTEAAVLPTPKIVERIPKGYISMAACQVLVYDKKKAAEVTRLPEAVAKDEAKQITAVGNVPPWRGDTQVTAIFDTGDGSTALYQRRLRPPFFAFTSDKELGVRYGTGIEVYGRWTFLCVGSFYLAAYGEAGDERGFAGADISYRW